MMLSALEIWTALATVGLILAALVYGHEVKIRRAATAKLKATEKALEDHRGRFRAMMDHAPVLVTVKDLDGRYTFVNRAYLEAQKLRADQVIGKTIYDVHSRDHADFITRIDGEVVATNVPVQTELTRPGPSGPIHLLFIKFPLSDADGKVTALGSIAADVTELKRSAASLAHAQRMEAIGQLSGGIAHDFNNLLTAIQLNADLLAVRLTDPAIRPIADAIRVAAASGGALTKRLLAFSRRQTVEARATDLRVIIEETEQLLQRTLGAQIRIGVVCADDLWGAKVDPGQFEAALLNLAVNARDAMPHGGKLTIDARNVAFEAGDAALNGVTPGDYVLIRVADNGSGMPPEVLARVFEPFYTTKEAGKGTGLGLSMVQGFVTQSKGHVTIQSEVGVGTVINLYLPRAEGESAARTLPAIAEAELPSGRETILLAEDDPLVRAYMADQLTDLGYRVTAVENAARALEHSWIAPDLLFTDIVMPGDMTGFDLARKFREFAPQTRVLFMSGYPRHGTAAAEMRMNGTCMLGKPFTLNELALRVRQVLDEPRGRLPTGSAPRQPEA